MDDKICRTFIALNNSFSNKLGASGDYQFTMNEGIFSNYCTNNNCSSNLDKINAGCLYLFDAFFKDSSVFASVAKSNINIVEYILIWLSYMLNLKEHVGVTNLQYFYNVYIQGGDKYKNTITDVAEYKNYKDLIDQKKYFLGMDSNIISNFYEVFKLLCEMYTNFDDTKLYCSICPENANKFVDKYKEMNKNSDITSNSSYKQLLSTLSNEYNNFKNYCTSKGGNCKDIPSLPSIETAKIIANLPEQTEKTFEPTKQAFESIVETSEPTVKSYEQTSAQTSEVKSSSSIGNKLIPVLSIFGAIAFFLGISYKYSLFGFRKRVQKQYLREKLKKRRE
ncbi:BIR protein [Plasmodium berghei]|uniref:BIR protein n=2 Tax=Plasmodium berghei TaxID=5821 RepID=A0A509AMB7_PLABA|nr:BIR protein [Plasmodium berghei ANKA]CXI47148.1 BIR protein [Plasmodium berghei]SBW38187.1 BIR protein [Plasmodium berghei]SCL83449.1 BIR protein [Plasmodium berghei]SCL84005.1 BIR protein [Plasmodium berghei]SCO60661.1 BIR protein [Plasmodium berghei]|eukprot:XP_034421791.1 BIR protein [Plasmodium berghei ANKA]